MPSDSELLDWIESTMPTISAIAKPYNGQGEVELSHWDVDIGIISFCRPSLRAALVAAMRGEDGENAAERLIKSSEP